MKFSPWIDPRVQQVRVADMRSYLLDHGWKPKPSPRPQIDLFEGPLDDDGKPIVLLVPATKKGRDYFQRIIELISSLAVIEDRYAVDVLNDILGQSAVANGVGHASTAETPKPRSE
jgi:hypothetical protein